MAKATLVIVAFPPSLGRRLHDDGSLDSGDPRLRAGQAQLSLFRLADEGRLVVQDAVLVTRTDGALPFVEDIVDDHGADPAARLGTPFWCAFFGAALHKPGDADFGELKSAVGPDSTSLALLASELDPQVELLSLAGELVPGARVVILDFVRCVDVVRSSLQTAPDPTAGFAQMYA